MLRYSWDCETYPNFFCANFTAIDNPAERYAFVIHKGRNDFDALMEFMDRDISLVGFNNIRFDDILVKAMMMGLCGSVKGVHTLANKIIGNRYDDIPNYWNIYNYKTKFDSVDEMMLHRLKEKGVGLKYAGVIIKHPKIQDLPIAPNTIIKPEEYQTVIDYCFNDCEITRAMFLRSDDEISIRQELTDIFGIDVMTLSRPQAGQKILLNLYSQKTNTPVWELKKQNSDRNRIQIKDCISPNLVFETEQLQNLRKILETVNLYKLTRPVERTLTVEEGKVVPFDPKKHSTWYRISSKSRFKYSTWVTLAGKTFDIGIGGLHSRDGDNPGVWYTNDEYEIMLADVSSYYPSLQSVYRIRPAHLDETYNEILDDLIERKLIAQKDGSNPARTYGFKIIINALYGQMGDMFSPFLDQQAMTTVTMSGQLFLLDLIEKVDLGLSKTKLLSANTDGVLYYVHKSEREKFKAICESWANRVGMNLDYDPFDKVVIRDVNNYLAISPKGKVKTKGVFYPGDFKNGRWERPLEKGYDAPIVAIAMYEYFVNGTPVEETIINHEDIYDFMIAQKVGRQFKTVIYDGVQDVVQQKTNRVIVTTNGVSLVKRHVDTGKVNNIIKGELLKIVNDVTDENAKNYPLRYAYYIDRAMKIIDLIDPPQATLF